MSHFIWGYAECHYAGCLYVRCLYAECRDWLTIMTQQTSIMIIETMLVTCFIICYAQCHYAECHYTECRDWLSITTLTTPIIMLNDIKLSVTFYLVLRLVSLC